MSADKEARLRSRMVETMRAMDARGLNRGTSGNLSARLGEGMLVTPSGVPPERLTPEAMVFVAADDSIPAGQLKPSSEWRMHMQILRRRPDVGAVVHCHSRHATILACAGRPIPAVHYMVGVSGGPSVPLAPYATFGSEELADLVVAALDGRNAALMANHGQITVAPTLGAALMIAEEIEEQAAVYWGCLAIGGPNLLSDDQMDEILVRFGSYGQTK
ncbi:class II aldolase/adducin family protein [Phenylobacterium sp.]|uniref:class II aldolase/adducin family protein n=1 Tax=Phenylobacterium sp. TaxID=1871053 RepID=UPI00272FB235|nr:class II aldolase/adducin family protein [Phenylobacterium sp.]MDP1616661.1 class II aldolase/adducin family protein [Phenylobacterium sp.]MDP1988412.1 class II aldolase/adducin family protein [Phenylobacterium sp.]